MSLTKGCRSCVPVERGGAIVARSGIEREPLGLSTVLDPVCRLEAGVQQ